MTDGEKGIREDLGIVLSEVRRVVEDMKEFKADMKLLERETNTAALALGKLEAVPRELADIRRDVSSLQQAKAGASARYAVWVLLGAALISGIIATMVHQVWK